MTSLPAIAERRFEQLRCLTEISRALTYTVTPEEVVKLATTRAAALLEAESAILMLTDETGVLRIRAAHGIAPEKLESICDRLDESLTRRLQEVLEPPLEEAFLGVPMVAHGDVMGLLAVVRRNGALLGEEEEWLLSAVADQVAVALENARLEMALRQKSVESADRSAGIGEAGDDTRDRALATLSHDLRSPLNAIDSYAELMEMELLGPIVDRQREALGRIRMSGRHLLAVLENVLEMARISAGVVRVHSGTVAVETVVEEAVLLVKPTASRKEQRLEVIIGERVLVTADADRLRQALVNVLGNAVKYTPANGRIEVRVETWKMHGRAWGVITVTDTGPGIPADKLQSIFRPYYRITSGDESGPEGTGLGLAISRELVRRMGGEIEVRSAPGQGAAFSVRLPLVSPEPSDPPAD